MGIEKSFNFRPAGQNITTSGVIDHADLQTLGAEGYQLVINLLPDYSEHAVADEQSIIESQGIRYVYIPVDFACPALEDYDRFCEALDAAQGQKVHIHCAANYRVSAFYALYARSRGLWSQTEGEEFVASLWNPAEHSGWREFMDELGRRGAGQ